MEKADIKLDELWRALASEDGQFQKWFCNNFGYNLFIVSRVAELQSDYEKYKRVIKKNGKI